jgi:hypothetical protein
MKQHLAVDDRLAPVAVVSSPDDVMPERQCALTELFQKQAKVRHIETVKWVKSQFGATVKMR